MQTVTKRRYKPFYCYDYKLASELKKQGFQCLTTAINQTSGNRFSLYIYDDDLKVALNDYNKKIK